MNSLSKTQKLAMSGMVMALYIVIMNLTQSFSFGQYQVRIATALYALSYPMPFLVLPLAVSNLLSNMLMGGMGVADMLGGFTVGLLTAGCNAFLGKRRWNSWFTMLPITLIPSLGVSTYLSSLLQLPYWTLAASLIVGQLIAGLVGAAGLQILRRVPGLHMSVKTASQV